MNKHRPENSAVKKKISHYHVIYLNFVWITENWAGVASHLNEVWTDA